MGSLAPASSIPITQQEERLTQILTNYYILAEQTSEKVRHLGNKAEELYNAAVAKWENERLHIPSPNDEEKRTEYFDWCNEICSKEPEGPEDCYRIIFATYAAIQVILDQDFLKIPEESRGKILGEANRLSLIQIQKK